MMPVFKDLTGKKFGRLIVIKRVENNKHNQVRWLCRCDCGNETIVVAGCLVDGSIKSCGCLLKESAKQNGIKNKTHGCTKTRIYRIWLNIKNRCYNSNYQEFRYYGERGIKVCDEWKNNFITFKDWAIKNGYNDNLSIDRIDNNGNYSPDNCRWATVKEQNNNKRNNKTVQCIETGKIYKTLTQARDETGISNCSICSCCKGKLKTAGGYTWRYV